MAYMISYVSVILLSAISCTWSVPPPEEDLFGVNPVAPPENGTTHTPVVTTHPPFDTTQSPVVTTNASVITTPVTPHTFYRYRHVTKDGKLWLTKPANESSIRIVATDQVAEEAVVKAAHTIALMVKYMPDSVFHRIANSHGAGIFSKAQGLTVYPEFAKHSDTPACRKICTGACHITCMGGGRKFSKIAGMTGGASYAVDSTILCNHQDSYFHHFNVMAHEFSHLIMWHLEPSWIHRINNAYAHAKATKTWDLHSYAMSNKNEYWAEAAGAFFLFTHLLYTSGGMTKCGTGRLCQNVAVAREFLHQHDPEVYSVLSYVFTDNHPEIIVPLKPCM